MSAKICTKCHLNKPLEDYHLDKRSRDGRRAQCRECTLEHARSYRINNADDVIRRKKQWYRDNPEWKLGYDREYHRNRLKDPTNRLINSLRASTRRAIRSKKEATLDLLGCSPAYFRSYLESLWQSGMNWENYGKRSLQGWEIDHIRPYAAFDLTQEEDRKRCFHYTNLQPLWKIDNIRKSNRMEVDGKLLRPKDWVSGHA